MGAVILAAGESKRLGYSKQLLKHEGQPLVRRAAVAAREAGAYPAVVVLGADAELVAPATADLDGVINVVNESWREGMATSLTTGLEILSNTSDCDGALVTLVDQPRVDAEALKRLIAAFDSKHRIIGSAYQEIVGVPVVFGREYFAELSQLTGDSGAGRWLRRHMVDVTTIPLDAAAFDVDTPSDATQLERPEQTSL